MPQTRFGETLQGWSPKAKEDLKADLNKVAKLPPDVLRSFTDEIAKTYPACNVVELAALQAERSSLADPQALVDVGSAFTYILREADSEPAETVVSDLKSLELISTEAASILEGLLTSAHPFREAAKVAFHYLQIGAPLFASISGTVDLRLRFHNKEGEFLSRKTPSELVTAQPVILANLDLARSDGEEKTVSFLMDENDLKYMKRFVTHMERALELATRITLVKPSETKSNG